MSSSGMDRSNSSSIRNISSIASRELSFRSPRSVCSVVMLDTSCFSSFATVARRRSATSVLAVMRCAPSRLIVPFQHERRVVAAEAERVDERDLDASLLRLRGDARQLALGIGILVVDRGVDQIVLNGHRRRDGADATRGAQRVTDAGLGGADQDLVGPRLQQAANAADLDLVTANGGRRGGINVVHLARGPPAAARG